MIFESIFKKECHFLSTQPKAQDTISKGEMKKSEIDESVDRLNTTFPECQSGNMKAPQICTNSIAREPAPEEEVKVCTSY